MAVESIIEDLIELITPDGADVLAIDDLQAGPKTTKKITVTNLLLAAKARANHTGTQLAATISDFAATVRSVILTGISFATVTAVVASDSMLVAIGKLQAQINAISSGSKTIFSDYIAGLTVSPTSTAVTSGTAVVLAEMTKTFTPVDATNKIELFFSGTFGSDSDATKDSTVHIGIFIDGVLEVETQRSGTTKDVTDEDKLTELSTFWQGTLSAAPHTIDVRHWVVSGDSNPISYGIDIRRNMIIKEIDE